MLISRQRHFLIILITVIGLLAAVSYATEIVTLTIEEESGVDRTNDPVTMGVPLPQGKVDDAAKLILQNESGKEIPCQVVEVTKWLDEKSVKWVHITWNQSIKANEKKQVKVVMLESSKKPAKTSLSAVEKNNTVTVQTGFVKFTVRGSKFNGIDAAWFDPTGKNIFGTNKMISGKGGGTRVKADDKEYLSTVDTEGKVVIEECGPRRIVIKATGRHMNGADKALDYTVRYYAYADSPIVRVQHVFICRQGKGAGSRINMQAQYLDLATELGGGNILIGTEKDPINTSGGASIVQTTSDSFEITSDDNALGSGKGKTSKTLTTGWVDLAKGNLGVAVGFRWFWQMNPKSMAVSKEGVISIGIYPEDAKNLPFEIYMGQSRTHYLTLFFHDDKTKPADINAVFAAAQNPLRAWAPPKYYCRDTHALGYGVENDPNLFPENWSKVEKWNGKIKSSIKQLLEKIDGNTYYGISRDSYGIYGFGDRYHYAWGKWKNSPSKRAEWKISWAGNYYDYPHGMLQQFLRTGDKTFLKYYWQNAIQIGDVHTLNWHPTKPQYIGACRYCPPRNHVGRDNGNPYFSIEYNHYKTQSVFANWYLTGDRRSLEHCKMLANNAYENHAADSGWASRGVGAQLAGLWNAYELWRDKKYFNRMKDMAYRAMKQISGGGYQKSKGFRGIGNEGICYYFWLSGDIEAIKALQKHVEELEGRATSNSSMSFCLALLYRATGDNNYADMAWRAIEKTGVTSRVHNGGLMYRNTHFALFLLSEASKNWSPVLGTKLPLNGFGPKEPKPLNMPIVSSPQKIKKPLMTPYEKTH
ncbi:MAG: hypothetical protein KAH23_03340 [Kiritimatiellae bacterium]|nr:hypothetical protein [Kiritimatiellia bacterium]